MASSNIRHIDEEKRKIEGSKTGFFAEDAFWSLKKKCGLGNVFSHTKMRPLLFCVSDTPKTALIYLKNGPNCCVRFYFGGRLLRNLTCSNIVLKPIQMDSRIKLAIISD